MKHIVSLVLFISAIFFVGNQVIAIQKAITTNDTAIYSAPNRSSPPVSKVTKDTALDILKRKGSWYQVQVNDQQTGWLPLLQIRFVSEQEANDQSIAEILRQTAEMPTAAGVISGVRGMRSGAQTLHQGESPANIEIVDQYIPTEDETSDFAEQGELKSQTDLKLVD